MLWRKALCCCSTQLRHAEPQHIVLSHPLAAGSQSWHLSSSLSVRHLSTTCSLSAWEYSHLVGRPTGNKASISATHETMHKTMPEQRGKKKICMHKVLTQLPTSSSIFSATSFPLGAASPPPPLTAGSALDFLASLSPWWVSSSGFLWRQNCLVFTMYKLKYF